jgi:hypothetical protein
MTTNILYLLLPFSIAWFGVLLRQVFEMERDRRFQRMWGAIAWSLIPFGASALVWFSQGGSADVSARNILLGLLGAATGAALAIYLGYVVAPSAPSADTASGGGHVITPPSTPAPAVVQLSPEESQKQQRQYLLESRGKLELAARDAAGTPIRVEFAKLGTESLLVKDGETEYQVRVGVAGPTGAWLYPASDSSKSLFMSKTIEHGKTIDIRQLRPSKEADVLQIGEHAFIVLPDRKILQLILVGAQWYRSGDDIDELRFKYKIYPADEFLFDSL